MTTVLRGALADRSSWTAVGGCPIERAMGVVGTRTAMLVLREAYYGTTRFEDFAERVGMTEAAAATRLRELVGAGLLAKRPYQEPGRRTRHEYVLTEAGTDLMPVVFGLFEWAKAHLPDPSPLEMTHRGCAAPVAAVLRCAAGHDVPLDEVAVALPGDRPSPPSP